MLPTLGGRIQTRIILLAIVGGIVTAIITPFLPLPAGTTMSQAYKTTFIILAAVIVVGIVWELIYHLIMQWRWEKDWPTFFGLITMINEGIVIWALLHFGLIPGIAKGAVPTSAFIIDFVLVWIVFWLWVNGPMRVVNIRWRFFGGRLV
ncbi:MAG TPA: hypothetical protein VN695_01225 [Streptosporangiaceae bacterium]|nr:hypothetical protein [Streptosporangiaceae bacterium]